DTRAAEALPVVTFVRDGDFLGVAAPDGRTAERALEALRAEWKPVAQPGAAGLFDLLKKDTEDQGREPGARSAYEVGTMAEGLAAASTKLEATYTVAYIAHAPLEPRAAVAEWSEGSLTVW